MKNVGTYTIDPEVLEKTANHMKGTLGYTAVQPSMDKGVYRSPDPELERKPSKLTPKEEESLHDKEKAMQEFQSRPTSVNISFGPTAEPATAGPEVNQNWKSAGVYNTNSNKNWNELAVLGQEEGKLERLRNEREKLHTEDKEARKKLREEDAPFHEASMRRRKSAYDERKENANNPLYLNISDSKWFQAGTRNTKDAGKEYNLRLKPASNNVVSALVKELSAGTDPSTFKSPLADYYRAYSLIKKQLDAGGKISAQDKMFLNSFVDARRASNMSDARSRLKAKLGDNLDKYRALIQEQRGVVKAQKALAENEDRANRDKEDRVSKLEQIGANDWKITTSGKGGAQQYVVHAADGVITAYRAMYDKAADRLVPEGKRTAVFGTPMNYTDLKDRDWKLSQLKDFAANSLGGVQGKDTMRGEAVNAARESLISQTVGKTIEELCTEDDREWTPEQALNNVIVPYDLVLGDDNKVYRSVDDFPEGVDISPYMTTGLEADFAKWKRAVKQYGSKKALEMGLMPDSVKDARLWGMENNTAVINAVKKGDYTDNGDGTITVNLGSDSPRIQVNLVGASKGKKASAGSGTKNLKTGKLREKQTNRGYADWSNPKEKEKAEQDKQRQDQQMVGTGIIEAVKNPFVHYTGR